jgi:hypothetical protein
LIALILPQARVRDEWLHLNLFLELVQTDITPRFYNPDGAGNIPVSDGMLGIIRFSAASNLLSPAFTRCASERNNTGTLVSFSLSSPYNLETAMKYRFGLISLIKPVFATMLIFGITSVAQAQDSAKGKEEGSKSGASAKSKSSSGGKTGAEGRQNKQDAWSLGQGGYAYGKDQASDYSRAQGGSGSGQPSYTYGRDAASDYARAQGGGGQSTNRGSAGMGSSSSQSDYD